MDVTDASGRAFVAANTEADPAMDAETGHDPLLNLLVAWEERRERGEDATAEALCGGDPRWVDSLRLRIAKRKRLHALLGLRATPDEAPEPSPEIPGHEILGAIGRGGMGVVYRARDVRLGRIVALKTVAHATHATRAQLDRFLDEARAVARLRHPNIIAIHAIGEHHGRPYLSLEYAEGGNLAQRLSRGPMQPLEAAALVESLALAVHAAHYAQVVHRDLKPSNVLLTGDGIPKVSDFGLAKLLDDTDSARTWSGQVIGTPSFMAPEQAEGQSKLVGPTADIYALGAIFYQALTGRPPFLGDSVLETLKQVTSTEVLAPTRLRPDVPRDLETICLKCLEKEPRKRYLTGYALADDLARFREGRPIRARPVGPGMRLWRWALRNRTLAAVTALLISTFAVGAPCFFVLWLRARADRAHAESERALAMLALGEAQRANRQADAARHRAELTRDRALSAVRVLLGTEMDSMLIEEMRPYRRALTDAGLREAQALVRALEGDAQAEIQRVFGYLALAQGQFESGEAAAAIRSGGDALKLAEAMVAREPGASARDALAFALHRLARIARDPKASRAYAHRSNAIFEDLRASRSGDSGSLVHLIALNDYNIGHSHYSEQQLPEAIAAFEASRRICEEELKRGNAGSTLQSDLARTLLYLCRTYKDLGRRDDALAAGTRSVAIYRLLLDRDPADYTSAMQLTLAHEELGFVYEGLGQWHNSISCHEAARTILKAAALKQGGLVSRAAGIQEQLAIVDHNLAQGYASDVARYFQPMREVVAEAYAICDKLTVVEPLSEQLKAVLAMASFQMAEYQLEDGEPADLEHLRRAERLWDELLRRDPATPMYRAGLVMVRLELADELLAHGKVDEARGYRDRSLSSVRGIAEVPFEVALNYASNARLVGLHPTKLDSRGQQERRTKLARHAIRMLHTAVENGFRDAARLRNASELMVVESEPTFQAIALRIADLVFPSNPFAGP
jgi:tetratricopeptide (TPR) repeat protein